MEYFEKLYKGNYKRLILVPLSLFIVCLFLVLVYPKISLGIDLKGGTMIMMKTDKPINSEQFKAKLLEKYPLTELSVIPTSNPAGGYGVIIQFSDNADFASAEEKISVAEQLLSLDDAKARDALLSIEPILAKYGVSEKIKADNVENAISDAKALLSSAKERFVQEVEETAKKEFSIKQINSQRQEVGTSLGENFASTAITILIIAVVLIILVVFAFFREIVPSLAILGAALFDIVFSLAAMSVFSIPLSLSSIPAILMIIGYSIDTDVLLTTRVLKRKENTERERAAESVATGLTMTFTTLAALVVMLVFSYFFQIITVFEIAAVLFFGLVADIPSTWLMNAPVLLWYAESKKGASR